MKVKTLAVEIDPKALSFEQMRQLIDEFLSKNPPQGKILWDCMAAVRGPDQGFDAPAALCDGSNSDAEQARVNRKKATTTILRGRMFPGTKNCSSADIDDNPEAIVQLPVKAKWDHFDKHVFKVCQHLKIPYQIDGEAVQGLKVKVSAPQVSAGMVFSFQCSPSLSNVAKVGMQGKILSQPDYGKYRISLDPLAGTWYIFLEGVTLAQGTKFEVLGIDAGDGSLSIVSVPTSAKVANKWGLATDPVYIPYEMWKGVTQHVPPSQVDQDQKHVIVNEFGTYKLYAAMPEQPAASAPSKKVTLKSFSEKGGL